VALKISPGLIRTPRQLEHGGHRADTARADEILNCDACRVLRAALAADCFQPTARYQVPPSTLGGEAFELGARQQLVDIKIDG